MQEEWKSEELTKEIELIKNIIKTREELKNNNRNFEYANIDLVDYYIYLIKANQAKLDYLLKIAKSRGITVDIINQITTRYVEDLVSLMKEKGKILTFAKGIFIGGGSIRLKKWIDKNQEIYKPYYIDSIHANAKGYEACLNAIQNQKKSG